MDSTYSIYNVKVVLLGFLSTGDAREFFEGVGHHIVYVSHEPQRTRDTQKKRKKEGGLHGVTSCLFYILNTSPATSEHAKTLVLD